LNRISPIEPVPPFAENVIDVVVEEPKIAVPVGTVWGTQLVLVFQSLDPGLVSQVASWA
jgi:hypothetical protein